MQATQAQSNGFVSWLGIVWLNAWFWVLFALITILLAVVSGIYWLLFDVLFPKGPRARWLIRRIIRWYGSTVLLAGWPLIRVRFVDLRPEEQPPFIYTANHRSACDAFLAVSLNADAVQMLNIWPSRLPLVNYLSKTSDYIRVREIPFEQVLSIGARLWSDGVSIIAFPEGTRSRTLQIGPFHGSAFRLAHHVQGRICPVAISGSEDKPRRGSWIMHPGKIVITKLPSLPYEQYKDLTAFAVKNRVRKTIEEYLEQQAQKA
jgi:1-acyl-sn-glycerol-3-phosphate acyltransferase